VDQKDNFDILRRGFCGGWKAFLIFGLLQIRFGHYLRKEGWFHQNFFPKINFPVIKEG